MSRKSLALLIALIVAPAVFYLLWPTDEARIRKLIKEGASAVENEDLEKVMSKVSFGYRDEYGLSYMLLKETLKRHFEMYSDIEVQYEAPRIEVKGEAASASLDVRVIASEGGMRGYVFGDLDRPMSVGLGLEKDPAGRWLVGSATLSEPPIESASTVSASTVDLKERDM